MPQPKSFFSRYKAPIVVFGVFLAAALLLLFIARHIVDTKLPSTPLACVIGFAWACVTMIVSGSYAIATGRSFRARSRTQRGQVRLHSNAADPSKPDFNLTGPGGTAAGELDVHVTSYVPAIINGVSAVGLAVFVVAMRTHGYSTLYGTAIGLLMPCYMVGWAWNSWPRVRRASRSYDADAR